MSVKQKPMHAQQIEPINNGRRDQIIPHQITPRNSIRARRDQQPIMRNRPSPRHKPHVPIPMILIMHLASTPARNPGQFRTFDEINNRLQEGERHDNLHVLDG